MTPSYSVSFRLRRVTVEEAHVSVPITQERTIQTSENTRKLDVEKLVETALEMGHLPTTVWKPDGEAEVTLHPLQTAPASQT